MKQSRHDKGVNRTFDYVCWLIIAIAAVAALAWPAAKAVAA